MDDDIYSLGEVFVRILYGRYATGVDLASAGASGVELPPVARVLNQMLEPRSERCSLSHVSQVLDDLRFLSKPSEPRPIVMSMFLGIGSVATVSAVLKHLRNRKKDMSIFSRQSKLHASFCVAQGQGQRASLQDYYCHARIPWDLHAGARSWRLLGIFDGHGGKDCAKFAAQFLPHEVRRMLREEEEEASKAGNHKTPSILNQQKVTMRVCQSFRPFLGKFDPCQYTFPARKCASCDATGRRSPMDSNAPLLLLHCNKLWRAWTNCT